MTVTRLNRRVGPAITAAIVGGILATSVGTAHAAEIDLPSGDEIAHSIDLSDGSIGIEVYQDFPISGPSADEEENVNPPVFIVENLNQGCNVARKFTLYSFPSWTALFRWDLIGPDGKLASRWVQLNTWAGSVYSFLPLTGDYPFSTAHCVPGRHVWNLYYERAFGGFHLFATLEDNVTAHAEEGDNGTENGDGVGAENGIDTDGATGGPSTGGSGGPSWAGGGSGGPNWQRPGHGRPNDNRPSNNRPAKPSAPAQPSRPAAKHPVTGADASWIALAGAALTATGGTLAVTRKRR